MGIVGWGWNGHTPRTTDVRVTELIGQTLELIRIKMVVIPEDMVVGWSAGTLSKNHTIKHGFHQRIYNL